MPEAFLSLNSVLVEYPTVERSRSKLFPSLKSLKYSPKTRHTKKAVHGVTLELRPGQRLGVLGRNGAGKTTLLKTAAKILRPTSGLVTINGTVGVLFGGLQTVHGGLTPRENTILHSDICGFDKEQQQKLLEDVENFVELKDYFDQPLYTHSAGMSARFNFALMTSTPKEILLLDEGIGAGDKFFQQKAFERLQSFYVSTKIMMIASHSTELIRNYCNEACLLEEGKIIKMGPVEEVIDFYGAMQT